MAARLELRSLPGFPSVLVSLPCKRSVLFTGTIRGRTNSRRHVHIPGAPPRNGAEPLRNCSATARTSSGFAEKFHFVSYNTRISSRRSTNIKRPRASENPKRLGAKLNRPVPCFVPLRSRIASVRPRVCLPSRVTFDPDYKYSATDFTARVLCLLDLAPRRRPFLSAFSRLTSVQLSARLVIAQFHG